MRGRRVARARGPDPRSQKQRAPTPSLGGVDRARAGLGRELPARTGDPTVGGPRPRAPPVLPGVADAGSKSHAAARVGKRGEMALHDGAARAGSDARSICGAQGGGRRGGEWCVGAGAEGWAWEGCGRPTERDARDNALGRRRRKRPLAELAAQARGVPAHCVLPRMRDLHGRTKPCAVRAGRSSTGGCSRAGRTAVPATTETGHLVGPLDGYQRRADERPHSRSSKGSRWSACDASGTEFLAISMVTTWTPRRALFGELVLDNQPSDRDRCWGGQGAGSTLCRSATGEEGPMWTVRPHRPAAYGMHGAPRFQQRRPGRSLDTGAI